MISLSPLPTVHPNTFQRKPVRPSSQCYPTFSLTMGRSQSFASASTDYDALFGLAFAPAARLKALNLASEEQLVGSLCKRHAVTPKGSDSLQAHGFRFFFTPLLTVLFTFPSRYWSTIGLPVIFSLAAWSPQIQTGFHVSRPTQVVISTQSRYLYGTITLFDQTFQIVLVPNCVFMITPTTPTTP